MVEPPSSPALCHLAKFPSCVEVENDAWPSEARKSEAVEGDFFFQVSCRWEGLDSVDCEGELIHTQTTGRRHVILWLTEEYTLFWIESPVHQPHIAA